MYVKTLTKVASRYAPSRVISFDIVHIFKALQLIKKHGYVSRDLLCKELVLGEGSIKTLVKHLKMNKLIETSHTGTKMTRKGLEICGKLVSFIPAETKLQRCSIAIGKFNYAVLLKEYSFAIKSGIEQRDAAIKMGGTGATTLLFKDNKFTMPNSSQDCLRKEPHIRRLLIARLKPEEGNVVIIGSADNNGITAELAAKNAAILTLMSHEKHN
jgi:RIO-like serine/threonine protein kinase